MKRVVLALAMAATTAHANVWQHAIEKGTPDPAKDVFESELKSGDELAMSANARGASPSNVRQLVQHAVTSYRNAAAAKPDEGEPYFRIGRLLYSFYFECGDALQSTNASPLCTSDPTIFDRKRAEEIIDAWNASRLVRQQRLDHRPLKIRQIKPSHNNLPDKLISTVNQP